MTTIEILKTTLYIVEGITLLLAVYLFFYTSAKQYKSLIWYFLFIVLAEQTGRILVEKELLNATKYWYNFVVIPIEFFFYFWYFHLHFSSAQDKTVPKFGSILLTLAFIADWIYFYDTQAVFISLSYTLGNLILLVIVLMYFRNLIHSKRILHFTTEIEFWISLGLLLFYLCTFPFFGLYNYFLMNYPAEFRNYYIIMLILNILMYLIFSVGLLWTKYR